MFVNNNSFFYYTCTVHPAPTPPKWLKTMLDPTDLQTAQGKKEEEKEKRKKEEKREKGGGGGRKKGREHYMPKSTSRASAASERYIFQSKKSALLIYSLRS